MLPLGVPTRMGEYRGQGSRWGECLARNGGKKTDVSKDNEKEEKEKGKRVKNEWS